MGLNYSFELWVEREKLFDFFAELARFSNDWELSGLVWPDGRRLPLFLPPPQEKDITPVFSPPLHFDRACLSLPFPLDAEILADYANEKRSWEEHHKTPFPRAPQNGFYSLGCFYLRWKTVFDWRAGESLPVQISFTAATTSMSRLFENSPSIREFFLELAARTQAFACVLNREGNGDELLWLEGDRHNFTHPLCEADVPPRYWRPFLLKKSGSEMWECAPRSGALSRHELMEVLLAREHPDSGVRGWACQQLIWSGHGTQILPLLSDPDWRVRAGLASQLWRLREEVPPSTVLNLIHDAHPEVAERAIWGVHDLVGQFYEPILALLKAQPFVPERYGLQRAALVCAARMASNSRNESRKLYFRATLNTLLQKSDFPFPHTARALL